MRLNCTNKYFIAKLDVALHEGVLTAVIAYLLSTGAVTGV